MADPTPTPTPPADAAAKPAPPDTAPDDKPLGPEGEKALTVWKERAKAAEKDAKRARELETELQRLREQSMTEQEKAIAKAREEATAEARKEAEGKYTRALTEAKAVRLAAGKLADPEDAARFLDVDELGDDDKAIGVAIDDLLKHKPYLAASAMRASVDQGPRGPHGGGLANGDPADMNALIRRAAGRTPVL